MSKEKKTKGRQRDKPVKKWDYNDETAIINYLKNNPNFEKPTARAYYSKFLDEYKINVYWKLVHYKVRNMRTVHRRAKEYGMNREKVNDMDAEDMRSIMLKICWYVNDFDLIFANDKSGGEPSYSKASCSDDESYEEVKGESFSNNPIYNNDNDDDNNSTNSVTNQLLHEEPKMFNFPRSLERDILAVQTGKFNFKNKIFEKGSTIKQQELDLARDKLSFEQETFRSEIQLKEKKLKSEEKLKIMELQMKERVAMKELELKERLAIKSKVKTQDL